MKIMNQIKRLFKEDSGISAVEYALLVALIGTGIAAAAFSLGTQVKGNIETAETELAGSV